MKSSQYSVFHPVMLTRLGGLITFLASTIALGSASQDQSGTAAAIVSESFRKTLGGNAHAPGVVSVIREEFHVGTVFPEKSPTDLREPIGHIQLTADPAQDFRNLLRELERIASQSAEELPMQEVRVDVMKFELDRASSPVQKICEFLNAADTLTSGNITQLEIHTYAASPTPAAWIEASREADRLRTEVTTTLLPSQLERIQVMSSAGLWSRPNQPRPEAAIVFLLPKAY